MTQYKHRVTLACPEALLENANNLACIMGENSADINTFREPTYEDADNNKYSVCSTVVTETFLSALLDGLPETPAHAEGIADRSKAQVAFDSINSEGGLLMVVDIPPKEALESLGLARIEIEGDA